MEVVKRDETMCTPATCTLEVFYNGNYSDVTVKSFGHEYNLHTLILSNFPFFAKLFGDDWNSDGETEFELNFGVDPNITKESFDLIVKYIYGMADLTKITDFYDAFSVLATANYLGIPGIIKIITENVTPSTNNENLRDVADFCSKYEFGQCAITLSEKCQNAICFYLENMAFKHDEDSPDMSIFTDYPSKIVLEALLSDKLIVSTESKRIFMIVEFYETKKKLLLDRSDDIEAEKMELQNIKESLNRWRNSGDIPMAELLKYLSYKDFEGGRLLKNWAVNPLGFASCLV